MALPKIGAMIVLDGEKEYKQAVSACTKSMGTLRSEMNLIKAQYSTSANSLEALQKKQENYTKQQEEQKKKIEEIRKAHEHARESQEKVGNGLVELKSKLSTATEKMEQMKNSYDTVTKELDKQEKEVAKLNTAIAKGEENYQKAGNELVELKTKLSTATEKMEQMKSSSDTTTEELAKQEKEIAKLNTAITKGEKSYEKSGSALTELKTKLSAATEKMEQMKNSFIPTTKELDKQEKELEKLNIATAKGEKNYQKSGNVLTELKSKLSAATEKMEQMKNSSDTTTKEIAKQEKEIAKLNTAITKGEKNYQKSGDVLTELKSKLSTATEKMEQMKNSFIPTTEELDKQKKEIEELNIALKKGEENYQRAGNKVEDWQKQLNNAQSQEIKLNNEINLNEKYLKEAESATDKCAKSIDEFGKEAKDTSVEVGNLGEILKVNILSDVIINGIEKIATGIKTIATSAISVGSDFEAGMSQVAATMGMTSEQINNGSLSYNKLSDAAKECGETTKYSSTNAAEALNYLALAGYDVDKSVKTLPKVLNLASAGGLDLAYASDMVTDSMAALELETNQLDTYIDQLAKTSQKSNTDVAQLGEGILTVGGTAKNLSGGITELNTTLGIFADNGIKGAEGGTHLRNIILAMIPTTDKAATAFEKLGLQSYDADGKLRPLNETFKDLDNALKNMSEEEKQSVLIDIFNKTDLAAVEALLSNCGDRFDELSGYIKNSNGAAKEMADTMENNLKGKITTLGSAAEALGITIYEKFDTTFKGAVTSVTESISGLNEEIKYGDLGTSMDNLADSFAQAADKTIDFATDALPKVINGLTWLFNNTDAVATGISGIATAMLVNKAGSVAVQMATDAYKAYKAATESATVAQAALNVVQNANPIGLLTTAILGVTGAIVALKVATKNNVTESEKMVDSLKKCTESAKEFNEAASENKKNREADKENMEYQSVAAQTLADKLYHLADVQRGSSRELATMSSYVTQLNELIPDLNLSIDDQTGKLSLQKDEVQKLIEANLQLAKVQAAQEDMSKIAEDQYQAEKQLTELEVERADILKKLNALENEKTENMENAVEKYGDNMDKMTYDNIMLEEQIRVLNNSLADADDQIKTTKDTIGDLSSEYETAYNYVADNSIGSSMTDAAGETGEAVTTINGKMEELNTAYQEALTAAQESITGQVGLFDELSLKSELTTAQMAEKMTEQAESWNRWSENLQKAQQLVQDGCLDEGVLGSIQEMGVSGAAYLDELVNSSTEDMAAVNEAFSSLGDSKDKVVNTMAEIKTNFTETMNTLVSEGEKNEGKLKNVGADNVKGFQKGTESEIPNLNNCYSLMFKTVLTMATDTFDIHSPSKVFYGYGKNNIEGLANGTLSSRDLATGSMKEVADSVLNEARNNLASSNFISIGGNIAQGIASGIANGASSAVNAVIDMATSIINAVKDALDIHSPSRVMEELGEYTGEGFENGAIPTFSSAINKVKGVLDGGINDINTNISFNASTSGINNTNTDNISDLLDGVTIQLQNVVQLGNKTLKGELANCIIKEITRQKNSKQRSLGIV